jgi:CRP-like cAMP-binding protein
MDMHSTRTTNRLLERLGPADRTLLEKSLVEVTLAFQDRLERTGEPLEYAYFVTSGMVSVIAMAKDHQIEVGMVGHEGMVGLGIVLGVERPANDSIVQSAGEACRIAAADLVAAMAQSASLRALLLRYVQAFTVQASQTALANGLGRIEERLARWILMWSDRLRSDVLPITHEFLALLLGIRRPSATVALHILEGKRLIRSTRGAVQVLDRQGLEQAAHGFYGVPEAQYDRIISP